MAQFGADIEQLEGMSKQFSQEAGTVADLIRRINGHVTATWWQGKNADEFRNRWNQEFSPALGKLAEVLTATADEVRTRAEQQDLVSNR